MSAPTSAGARDAQRAFVGLLARPLVTPATDPELHRLVVRHMKAVTDSARRLGYRIQRVGRAIRLVRVPISGRVTAPPRPADAPARRVLSLACCLAACCEEISGTVTLQRLSDMVRDLIATPGMRLGAYDPETPSSGARRQLRDAAKLLEHWGVLRLRTSDDTLLDQWTEHGQGIGAGYEVDRDALLLMTSPDVLDLALSGHEDDADPRTVRHLRGLVETPAVLYADLDHDDAEALRASRGSRASDAAAITGGQVEARAEGLVLTLLDDERPATVADWPRARAADWVALLMADLAGRHGERTADGDVELTARQVDEVVEDLTAWRGEYMSKAQRGDPAVIRADAEQGLTELGLLRVHPDGGWTLLSVAARYRDPDQKITDNSESQQ
jgi:uncharacterized protein (TIGR02678 family)